MDVECALRPQGVMMLVSGERTFVAPLRRPMKPAKNGGGRAPSVSGYTSNLTASSFSPPSFAAELPPPAEGWARELRKLEKELQNTRYQDAAVVMSAAKVARIMRQFDLLEKILAKAAAVLRLLLFISTKVNSLISTTKQLFALSTAHQHVRKKIGRTTSRSGANLAQGKGKPLGFHPGNLLCKC